MCTQHQSCSYCPLSPSGEINCKLIINKNSISIKFYHLVNQVLELHSSGQVSARIKGEGLHLATNQFIILIMFDNPDLRCERHLQLHEGITGHSPGAISVHALDTVT